MIGSHLWIHPQHSVTLIASLCPTFLPSAHNLFFSYIWSSDFPVSLTLFMLFHRPWTTFSHLQDPAQIRPPSGNYSILYNPVRCPEGLQPQFSTTNDQNDLQKHKLDHVSPLVMTFCSLLRTQFWFFSMVPKILYGLAPVYLPSAVSPLSCLSNAQSGNAPGAHDLLCLRSSLSWNAPISPFYLIISLSPFRSQFLSYFLIPDNGAMCLLWVPRVSYNFPSKAQPVPCHVHMK